jgi:hypothetical protein
LVPFQDKDPYATTRKEPGTNYLGRKGHKAMGALLPNYLSDPVCPLQQPFKEVILN